MRSLVLLPLLLLTSIFVFGQTNKNINPNDVFATFSSAGALFYEGNFEHPGYINAVEYGQTDVPFQIFAADIVYIGYNDDGLLRGHVGGYDRNDFFPGPLSSVDGLPVDMTKELFDEVYVVPGEDILSAKIDFEDNGQIDSELSNALLAWPGHNNPHFESIYGFILPDENMAPFLDRNQNGDYEPMLGDLPVIGDEYVDVIPNELLFIMFNDFGDANGLILEYHVLVFGFSCEDNQDINQTLFTKTSLINKSANGYHDVKIGFFEDFDLGCPVDDYVGCDPINNLLYCYNADEIDGISGTDCVVGGGISNTFGESPGVVSTKYLNVNMDVFSLSQPRSFGSPFTALEALAMTMQGVTFTEVDSVLIFDTVSHIYPDYPSEIGGDHMVTADRMGDDFRTMSGTTIDTLWPGEEFVLFNSWYSNIDEDMSAHQQPDKLMTAAPIIQQFFDDGFTNCTQVLESRCVNDCVWPGDANVDGYVYHDDLLVCGYAIANDLSGSNRTYTSHRWLPFTSTDWSETINAKNAKHADCFGDGVADEVDFQVVLDNYRNIQPGQNEPPTIHANTGSAGLRILFRAHEFEEGRPSILNVPLRGDMPMELVFPTSHEIVGYSFSTHIDTSIYVYNSLNWNSAEWEIVENGDQVFYSKNDLEEFEKDVAIFSKTGSILLGELLLNINSRLRIRSDLRVPDGQEKLHLPFPINNLRAIDVNGDFVALDLVQDSLFLVRELSSTQDVLLENSIAVFPNPSRDMINLELPINMKAVSITLMDQAGQILQTYDDINDQLGISTRMLSNGVYLLNVEFEGGTTIVKRAVVMR